MEYEFSTLIDIDKTQALLDSFCEAVGIASAIIDLEGKVLIGSRWQKICTDFHRMNTQSCAKCIESDTRIANQLNRKRSSSLYRCRNGLTDAAAPIVLEGKHVANFFVGQFLLEPADVEFFRRQAAEYGFDEKDYLDALASVPVIPEEKLNPILEFLVAFAEMLGEIGLNRKRELEAAEELKTTEERFRDILNLFEQVVWSTDEDGSEVLHTRAAAEQIYGRPVAEILCNGSLRPEIVHPDDREKFRQATVTVRELGAFEHDFRIIRPDGEIRWLHNRARLVRDPTGQPIRIDGIATDITSRKQAEELRRQLEGELQHSQKLESLGVMAGGIAHDFNNLLTVIRGNADILAKRLSLAPEKEAALRNIQTAASHAGAITRALQAFSRPTRPEIHTVDANVLVQEARDLLRHVLPATIEFQTRLDPGTCAIAADPAQMQQVLVNLCVNARDAMPDGGTLNIETRLVPADALPPHAKGKRSRDRYLRIRVSDTGCGMDTNTLKRMFDPFFTTKPKDMGTGLGLAIVYRIVEAHRGIIDVASRSGEGTRIDLFFPAAESAEVEARPCQRPAAGRNGRILVVDDEEMIASLLRTLLESLGHVVLVATQAEDAIKLACSSDRPFDLVIIDYYLSHRKGTECLEAIRRLQPGLKAIIISGYGPDAEQIRQPDTRIVCKPFSTDTIAQAVWEELEPKPADA